MRITLALLALLAAACSTTECEYCAGPDRPADIFVDTDDDGVPDTRLVHVAPTYERRIELKLMELEKAIAELRRELQRR